MRGRPTKLDPATVDRIVELVRAGNFMEVAAATCGVHRTTLFRWLKKGETESRGAYRDFYLAVMKAHAESEARDLMLITKAAPADWRAAAWRLERRYPRRYGPQVQVTLRQEMENLLGTLRNRLPPDAYQGVMNAIAAEDEQIEEAE